MAEVTQDAINHGAGPQGDAILSTVTGTDMGLVAGWQGTNGGNCFFACVQMMANLNHARSADGFMLVTGIFAHPDLSEPVVHSWLEKNRVVLNVSNLTTRPLYVAPRDDYYRANFLTKRIQQINPQRVARMIRSCDGDVRAATKRLMKPTFSHRRKP